MNKKLEKPIEITLTHSKVSHQGKARQIVIPKNQHQELKDLDDKEYRIEIKISEIK